MCLKPARAGGDIQGETGQNRHSRRASSHGSAKGSFPELRKLRQKVIVCSDLYAQNSDSNCRMSRCDPTLPSPGS